MAIFTKKIIVKKDDIDVNGHVSNIRYLEWFMESAVEHSDFLGVGVRTLQQINRTWVAKEHHISYKQSAFEGDELILKTWVDSVKIAQSIRKYELCNAKTNKIVCEGWTNWVFVEAQNYRPHKIPIELIGKYLETKDNS
ncbi:MAG: acyl-CoA thioesterase [Sulfurovaceae bacterium]|nr:acyl-CoA thioesterase [Sulfurovaceae bacterium]MDD5548161.1 acyl-CoA thioesterase [Sulfurovaceae bacterium]